MESLVKFLQKFETISKNTDLLLAGSLIGILAVMLVPLPSFLLDISLTLSLSLALLILLVAIYTEKTLEFSVFPSLLLITTLFRLSLNVASTRLILTDGHQGPDSAGQVISAFGNFVVGNNYVIGLIVFIILVVINFIVITKGSGRVAEVAARFTLDAMPGKQMSIDADLSSGLITEDEARNRRKEIESEADFYGSMDGASKFVRGDAIAGIIITFVNVLGGLLVGVLQKDLSLAEAAKFYTMLTVGDGLVSQIPALIISTAAGIIVTRESSTKNMGQNVASQLFLKPKVLGIVAFILVAMALVPGLPKLPFIVIAALLAGASLVLHENQKQKDRKKLEAEDVEMNKPQKENIESLLPIDLVELEVGYGLINIVESDKSGDLLERIVSIRKQFALDMGFVVPSVNIRDNLELGPGEYQILIKGNKIAGGDLKTDCFLAMDPGDVANPVEGVATKEPAFGLDAIWITEAQKERAEMSGYTVVDLPTVMATHLTETIRSHAYELLGRQEADNLVQNLKRQYPKVVEELIPDIVSLGTVVKVLQNLLREQVSIRDLLTIFETLADEGTRSKDPEVLTESVRKSLARHISLSYTGGDNQIPIMNLSAELEELFSNSLLHTEQGVQLVMDPQQAQTFITNLSRTIEAHPEIAAQPILLTSQAIRRHVYKLASRFIPQLIVLSHSELTSEVSLESVGSVGLNHEA